MGIIRLILSLSIIPAVIVIARSHSQRSRALRSLFVLAFTIATTLSVFFPDIWNSAAHFMGINSGLDLLCFVLALSVISLTAYTVRAINDANKRLQVVVQRIALTKSICNCQTNNERDI